MTGKEKCELLKQLRKEIAEANGIEYLSAECTYKGDCFGYCPKCDAEARYLDFELNRLAKEGKTIKATDISYEEFLSKIDIAEKGNNSQNDDNAKNTHIISEEPIEVMGEKTLFMYLEELDLSPRSFRGLKRAGLNTVEDLTNMTENDIICLHTIGKKGMEEILNKLHSLGLSLKEEPQEIILQGCPFPNDIFFDEDNSILDDD